ACFAGCSEEKDGLVRAGGAARVSLSNLRLRLVSLGDVSIKSAFEYVLEALILSQHFATAVNRFDGQNQRLRLTIEETWLETLINSPLVPTVTEDRLPTLLSLAAQSGLIDVLEEGGYSTRVS
ncbi:MAG: hypothetical protein ACU0BN_03080, partial [Sulfitobacter sp.]